MKFSEARLIYFSPTHTSRRVGEALVQGLSLPRVVVTDLTQGDAGPLTLSADVLTVVVLPVYGGHIPQLAAVRLAALRSEGGPVVPVVVYGNRDYDKALQELSAFLAGKGFHIVAAGTFVGEHSYSTAQYPIAPGRPDANDCRQASEWGHQLMKRLQSVSSLSDYPSVDVARIQRPKQPLWLLLRFIWGVLRLRRSGASMPAVPQVDEKQCTHCGVCVKVCPNQAIVAGDELHTLPDRCIRCCACVKSCPHQARRFDTPFSALLSKNFRRGKENRFIMG